ncbi:uncharacterized protein [Euphorbia lathyris]|uniref:uncharacterized protein isoform X2 n=1 Tax=Euphorbia lathyris TaxID=212925 RepID=UPI0033140A4E
MAAVSLILFPAILFSSLLDLTSQDQQQNHLLLNQLHDSKLKIAKLESSLEEIILKIEARDINLKEREKQIREMEERINYLQSKLSNLKSVSFTVDEKVNSLEEEVKDLWATLRKNNFDLYVLQSKAQEAEQRLQAATLNVEEMEEVVTEQWIQIQQFEQALQLREMAILKARRRVSPERCSFLKFMDDLSSKYLSKYLGPFDLYLFGKDSALRSFGSQTVHHFTIFCSRVKESHHELQGFIRREMESHEFTAHLANEELVFVVASALVIFPVLSAWLFLSSHVL